MNMMKYLVFDYDEIFIFPFQISHKEFAFLFPDKQAKRGGFVNMQEGNLKCFGEAFSLALSSGNDIDTNLLKRKLDY